MSVGIPLPFSSPAAASSASPSVSPGMNLRTARRTNPYRGSVLLHHLFSETHRSAERMTRILASYRRPNKSRMRSFHTRHTASQMMLFDILDSPLSRSVKTKGTSLRSNPALQALSFSSIWKLYPFD